MTFSLSRTFSTGFLTTSRSGAVGTTARQRLIFPQPRLSGPVTQRSEQLFEIALSEDAVEQLAAMTEGVTGAFVKRLFEVSDNWF